MSIVIYWSLIPQLWPESLSHCLNLTWIPHQMWTPRDKNCVRLPIESNLLLVDQKICSLKLGEIEVKHGQTLKHFTAIVELKEMLLRLFSIYRNQNENRFHTCSLRFFWYLRSWKIPRVPAMDAKSNLNWKTVWQVARRLVGVALQKHAHGILNAHVLQQEESDTACGL